MGNEIIEIKTEPRKVWKALLLSWLALGLGQIYNGQIKKFLILWTALIFVPIIFANTKLLLLFHGWVILAVIFVGLQLYAIIDACVSARLQKNYISKKYNKRFFYCIFGIMIYVVFWLFFLSPLSATQSVRTFKISMESNMPTLQIGDNVVADMRAYRNSTPDYGDIVIFNIDNAPYIFRVVGKPNDIVSIKDNSLIINNKPVVISFIQTKKIGDFQVNEYEEQLPNGCKYTIYKHIQNPYFEMANIDNMIIPADSYFLMGDNRDNATDSRYIGLVKREQIIGEAIFVLSGKSWDRININLNKN